MLFNPLIPSLVKEGLELILSGNDELHINCSLQKWLKVDSFLIIQVSSESLKVMEFCWLVMSMAYVGSSAEKVLRAQVNGSQFMVWILDLLLTSLWLWPDCLASLYFIFPICIMETVILSTSQKIKGYYVCKVLRTKWGMWSMLIKYWFLVYTPVLNPSCSLALWVLFLPSVSSSLVYDCPCLRNS